MANTVVGDIEQTPYRDKEIDVVLMIDVLEHVTHPEAVLREVARISRYLILKVPLEGSLYFRLMNVVTRGKSRARIIEKIGHINIYTMNKLKKAVAASGGEIVSAGYANAYAYLLTTKQSRADRVFNRLGGLVYRVSPRLAAAVFSDFALILVRYGENKS